ncbi:xaa-Pro aminopeptidase 2 isoform X2 [Rhinatrema bivittatum]|uniref:xaa-Pro aminopeptidase 2 isoform X2 n=1 Tax=Rhinatrema bivittatum TaxID=194408 RepID=UPI00112EF441|nr:xaa-Pro aminopeptidase 2 isoform X2 [Rhinatrema bivittatum]
MPPVRVSHSKGTKPSQALTMAPSRWSFGIWGFLLCGYAAGLPMQPSSDGETTRNCTSNPPFLPPTVVNTSRQLSGLRQQMGLVNVSAYIIPATDAHMSEYIAERDKRRAWMTGFAGSAGTAVVTMSKAALWTDSRYWTEAERHMDCNWELQKMPWINSIVEWLLNEIPAGEKIGFDPYLFSINDWNSYSEHLKNSGRILTSLTTNLVDAVWSARPSPPSDEIYQLQEEFTGSTWQEKVSNIRRQMSQHSQKPTAVLLSALDETAWLFNLRGKDIPYNPYFYSYTLLSQDFIRLFVNVSRMTPEVQKYLNTTCTGPLCVQLIDYNQVQENVRNYTEGNVKIWIGTEYTTYGLYEVIPKEKLFDDNYSPVMKTKAVKNEKEQQLMRKSHIRDAVAVIQFLVWLEKNVPTGTVDEISAANYVDFLRGKQKNSAGQSFATISASGLNAALAHYSPSNNTKRKLTVNEMYLIDSGGQYLDGTTDITRTLHWGTPTAFEKEAYTRVLMGNIDLTQLIFPSESSGRILESFARKALWNVGLNYGHGTGHGIGNFLAVHEWPVGFQSNNIPLSKGMFTSIEPGYYHDGEFGIRIEDVVLVVEAQTKHMFGGMPYLTFQAVTLVPYDQKLIDTSIMSTTQIDYLNEYYKTIRKVVGPELQNQNLGEEHTWLMRNTEPFSQGTLATVSMDRGPEEESPVAAPT